jgi:hypothetical protein
LLEFEFVFAASEPSDLLQQQSQQCSIAAFAGHFAKSNSDTVTQFENPAIPANLATIAAVIAKLPKRQPMQQANNDINQALNL